VIWGIDISAKCTGWCAGDGATTPICDVWTGYNETATDYGEMLHRWRSDLDALANRFPPTAILYEAPLLTRYDRLPTLRRTYSLGTFLELWGRDRGAHVREDDPKNLKRRLTGDSYAKKAAMVKMAKAMGVRLPMRPTPTPRG